MSGLYDLFERDEERARGLELENKRLREENERLKQMPPPSAQLESEVVTAYKRSKEYMQLMSGAFLDFLQEKFAHEFATSKQGEFLRNEIQKQFKLFESEYNKPKEVKQNAQSDKNPDRPATKATGR